MRLRQKWRMTNSSGRVQKSVVQGGQSSSSLPSKVMAKRAAFLALKAANFGVNSTRPRVLVLVLVLVL